MRSAREFALRGLIIVIGLGTLLWQVLNVPLLASEAATSYPEYEYLKTPYTVLAILALACIQVALGALWMLLNMVSSGVVFGERAFRWVDVIIASALVATALTLAVAFHLTFFVQSGGPVVLLLAAVVVGGVTFALLMIVMRGLLRKATAMHDELAEVV